MIARTKKWAVRMRLDASYNLCSKLGLGVISLTSGPEFYYLTSFSEGFVPQKRYIIGKTRYGCGIDGKLRISRF
jgi:hypothetical protein